MQSIYESETGFAKPSKPAPETVSLTNPETVQLFTLTGVDKITTKSVMYLFCNKYFTFYVECGRVQ